MTTRHRVTDQFPSVIVYVYRSPWREANASAGDTARGERASRARIASHWRHAVTSSHLEAAIRERMDAERSRP